VLPFETEYVLYRVGNLRSENIQNEKEFREVSIGILMRKKNLFIKKWYFVIKIVLTNCEKKL
jgi:hypothetical protein